MVMMFFITGSNGIFAGEDLKPTLPFSNPQDNGSWDVTNNVYSWTAGTYNLMTIFTGLEGKLNTDYVALIFTTSNYTSKYRVCFMDGGDVVATKTLDFAGENDY